MATTTVRLPEPLKAESEAFAASLGISLNALMAVALRDYLDGRSATPKSVEPSPGPSPSPPPPPSGRGPYMTQARLLAAAGHPYRKPSKMSDPCPCGAKDRNGYPVKWKHCHGKV